MASLKAIRRRISSAKSIQQITRAMKLVAAARLRRAQDALVAARPYTEALARVADSLLASEGAAVGPREHAEPRALLIAIASDRSLCGGYNSNLLRAAEDARASLESDGLAVEYYAVGKKTVDHFRRTKAPVAAQSVDNTPRLATVSLSRTLAARVLADYQSGAISRACVVYTHFRSAMTQTTAFRQLLPVTAPPAPEGEQGERPAAAAPLEYLVEPSRAEIVPVVLRSYVESAVFNALLESEASEQAARMTAMDNATNSAGDMIAALTLDLNRARQAQITRELMDIVGGAEALRGQGA
jgi:F-type H+-transporting ATPase subunit gamma